MAVSVFEIRAERVTLAILEPEQAELVVRYYDENRDHLEPWEPVRDDSFYDLRKARERLAKAVAEFTEGSAFHFAVIDNETGAMIGICNFSNVIRGMFQACHLGFAIAASHEGKGLMFESLQSGIRYMFETVGLHRVMANHLLHNDRSAALLRRLGFEREGVARSYLNIAGRWQDHVLNALINPAER